MVEISKEIIEKVYETIELAKKSGKIRKGSNEATKAIEKGKAKLVAIAGDITPAEIIMHIPLIAKEKGIVCVKVGPKIELGAAAGLEVGTSAVAIIEAGEGKRNLKMIQEELLGDVKPKTEEKDSKVENKEESKSEENKENSDEKSKDEDNKADTKSE